MFDAIFQESSGTVPEDPVGAVLIQSSQKVSEAVSQPPLVPSASAKTETQSLMDPGHSYYPPTILHTDLTVKNTLKTLKLEFIS